MSLCPVRSRRFLKFGKEEKGVEEEGYDIGSHEFFVVFCDFASTIGRIINLHRTFEGGDAAILYIICQKQRQKTRHGDETTTRCGERTTGVLGATDVLETEVFIKF